MKLNEKYYELKQMLNSINLAVLTMDLEGNIDYANKKMQEIFTQYPEGIGIKCYEVCNHVWSETGKKFCSWCGIDNVIRTGRAMDKIVKGKDGRQWLFSWAPIHDENKTIIKVIKTIADITEQMEEKDYLEGLLLDIFSIMPTGIMIFNGRNEIIFLNKAMEMRWKVILSQVRGINFHELDIYGPNDLLQQGFDNIKKGVRTDKIELAVDRHDGNQYWVVCSLIPFKKDKTGWNGILFEEDLTQLSKEKKEIEEDLKKKEKMLIDQDKLAAVGQLAAGIAHELNTPTTYVRGNMQTFSKYSDLMGTLLTRLQKDIGAVEKETILNKMEKLIINMKDIADSSFDGTSRIMKIISSMKTFVQSDRTMAEQINIYGPIQDALVLLFSRIKYSGKVFVNGVMFSAGEMNLTDAFKPIMMKGSAMRFTQLFIILLNNSIDAWESISEKEKSPLKIEITIIEQNNKMIIEISDNGGGIAEGVIRQIFEPFYTTKATKGGTGLGLSIARQIAAEHNSTIEVKNMPGHGVCFTITTGGLEVT